jgi:hypothetical protein
MKQLVSRTAAPIRQWKLRTYLDGLSECRLHTHLRHLSITQNTHVDDHTRDFNISSSMLMPLKYGDFGTHNWLRIPSG